MIGIFFSRASVATTFFRPTAVLALATRASVLRRGDLPGRSAPMERCNYRKDPVTRASGRIIALLTAPPRDRRRIRPLNEQGARSIPNRTACLSSWFHHRLLDRPAWQGVETLKIPTPRRDSHATPCEKAGFIPLVLSFGREYSEGSRLVKRLFHQPAGYSEQSRPETASGTMEDQQ